MENTEQAFERGQVIQIINSVIDKMEQNAVLPPDIVTHLLELSQTIDKLKKDIAEADPLGTTEDNVQSATDELDAIVSATADATNDIMAACEQIEKFAENNDVPEINEYVTNIYVACGFQDITGQRITKAVKALRTIESKVDIIMDALNSQVGPIPKSPRVDELESPANDLGDDGQIDFDAIDEKRDLLNGPQMPEKAVTQDDIDKLLAEFE